MLISFSTSAPHLPLVCLIILFLLIIILSNFECSAANSTVIEGAQRESGLERKLLQIKRTSSLSPNRKHYRSHGATSECPMRSLIRPCGCIEKSRGLDITCEGQMERVEDALEQLSRVSLGRGERYLSASTGSPGRKRHPNGGSTAMVSIHHLRLRHNTIDRLPAHFLEGLEVKHFLLHYSNLTQIDPLAFIGSHRRASVVESLDLSQNHLRLVPSKALSPLSSLVTLYLNYNQIQSIHGRAFLGLASLLSLSLFGNLIRDLDEDSFMGLEENLTQLNLGKNRLTVIPTRAISCLPALQKLQLQENRIKQLIPWQFDMDPLAKSLPLPPYEMDLFHGVPLQSGGHEDIHHQIFPSSNSSFRSLDWINLSDNQIVHLSPFSFTMLKSLSSLDLERNQISTVDAKAFYGLENTLEWLKLGENNLTHIPSDALQSVTSLRQLDLRSNRIRQIPRHAFVNFTRHLKFLYLQHNEVDWIEEGALDPLKESLEWLYLQSNELSTMRGSLFEHILPRLQVFDLHDNPFECSCDVIWFRDWITERRTTEGINLPRETKCSFSTSATVSKLKVKDYFNRPSDHSTHKRTVFDSDERQNKPPDTVTFSFSQSRSFDDSKLKSQEVVHSDLYAPLMFDPQRKLPVDTSIPIIDITDEMMACGACLPKVSNLENILWVLFIIHVYATLIPMNWIIY